ncbi:MAG: hypothetical protein R3C71_00195 [Candidatus Krumholzibacteriia bacterium]|nr:hypothetical protein [bacterium]
MAVPFTCPPRALLGACLLLGIALGTAGSAQAQRLFRQERSATYADGRTIPPLSVSEDLLETGPRREFALPGGRRLLVVGALSSDREAELSDVAALVREAVAHATTATGLPLPGNILLCLLEVERVPTAYRFEAREPSDASWCELRLAFVERSRPLLGPGATPEFLELLYDTLPHELGHDLLDQVPGLRQDLDGGPSTGTRWFCEGVCELIAKSFAQRLDPQQARRYRADRDVGSALRTAGWLQALLDWRQDSALDPAAESRAYGLAWRLVETWDDHRPLRELIAELARSATPTDGPRLRALLARDLGTDEATLALALGARRTDEPLAAGLGTQP